MSTKYSFVMPAYKAAFIREAIESILGQTYTDFELIIVDDASPEGLDTIVAEYHDPRLTYYKNEKNIGGKDLVAQWNHSIEYANGEFLILASDDDIYDIEYLSNIDILISSYPDIDVYRPLMRKINLGGKTTCQENSGISSLLTKSSFLEAFSYGRLFSGIPQYTFRISAIKSIGGFINYPMG